MQAAILKNRSKLDEHLISKLYRAAAAALVAAPKTIDPSMMLTRALCDSPAVLVTCTDLNTGLFVQLCGDPEKGVDSAFVTLGQKFCQEGKDSMRGNIATKIW